MAETYSRQPLWQKGDVISSQRLNNFEYGIREALGNIENMDNSDTGAADVAYVKKVTQANGKISVTHANFSPSISITAGTNSAAPKVNVTVAGNSGTAQAITTATTGLYGVTKLSSTSSSSEETLAATPKGVWNAINTLDVADTADTTKYVSQVSETNGKISVARENFSPSITITAGTADNAPKINVTVATNSGTAKEITKATTSVYGATKLSSTSSNSEEGLAATPKGVWTAINTLDVTDTADSTKYVSGVSETNGKITVNREAFNPSLSITTAGNSAQQLNLSVAGNTGATAVTLATASTSIYGVTKLSDATDSTSSAIAATSKAVKDSLDAAKTYADNKVGALDASITGTPGAGKTITAFNQTDGVINTTFSDISITKSQISDLTAVELLTPAQKNSIELFDDLINNFTFNLTLQLPTQVEWTVDENTNALIATPKTFDTDTTVTYKEYDGNDWTAYNGIDERTSNHTFMAHVARSHEFNGVTYSAEADINNTYIEPESEPEQEPEEP